MAASIIAYSGGETRSPDVRRSLQGLPAFLYGRIDEKTVDIRWKKPLQWEQKPCRAMEQEEFWKEQHRSIEFLLSWKDDVLMNCLSGRRDKAFDPQAMQKVRAACAVLAEDGTYPFDLSVTDPEIYRQVSAWFTDLLRKS